MASRIVATVSVLLMAALAASPAHAKDFDPLFSSAEDYIVMWEKALERR